MVSEADFSNCVKLRVKDLQYGSVPTRDLEAITEVILRLQDNSETPLPEVTKCSVPLLLLHSSITTHCTGGWIFPSRVGRRGGEVAVGSFLE